MTLPSEATDRLPNAGSEYSSLVLPTTTRCVQPRTFPRLTGPDPKSRRFCQRVTHGR